MPQLTRIRCCHVGHFRARMDDLILDFRDLQGLPSHSVLWLRNGGGKSTILNLVFGLLRPDRRELFGSKAEQNDRNLEEYIQVDIPGVVIAEWQLDRDPRSNPSANPDRYLTGVFYEQRSSGSSPDRLHRLFFAAKVIPEEPRFTLEGLPISTQIGESLRHRTLTSFKQEWHAIGLQHLNAEARETEHQNDWQQILDAAGIDAELFGYQLQMNRQEGGAADLFKFKETDEFVDFFLKLAIDPSLGNEISSNLDGVREQLRRRSQEFIPERELINGTLERLEPLIGLYQQREAIDNNIAIVKQELDLLDTHLKDRSATLDRELKSIEQQELTLRQETQKSKEEATLSQQRSIFFRYLAAQKEVQQLEIEQQELVKQDRQAQRDESIWKAAVPLQHLDRQTHKVKQLQAQIDSQQSQHTPLLDRLKSAAHKYKAALLAKLEQLQQQESFYLQTEQEKRVKAIEIRQVGSEHGYEAIRLEERTKHIAERIEELERSCSRLAELGIVRGDETWANAEDRLIKHQTSQTQEQQSIQAVIENLDLEIEQINDERSIFIRDLSLAAALEHELRAKLDNVQSERESIESDECLQHYLETEEIALDCLDKNVAIQLGQVERAIEQQVLDLWSGLLEQGETIEYLELHGLLPPSQDVRLVLDLLERNGITAWSGWKYISEDRSSEQIRDFIQRLPEVVLGAIVQTSHYEQAKQLLSTTSLNLATPIVLADQNIIDRDRKVATWTIGPSSNAYFDRYEARSELDNRKSKCNREQQDLDTKRQELIALRSSISRLMRFRQQYPTEWIVAQQDAIDSSIEQQQSCQVEIATLNEKQQGIKSEINSQRQHQQDLIAELAISREHLARLQEYSDRFPIELPLLKKDYAELIDLANTQKESVAFCKNNAEELDQQANNASTERHKNARQIGAIDDTISRIEYCIDEAPTPKHGNIQIFYDEYEQLLALYEQKVGANTLNILLGNAKKEAEEADRKFKTKLTNDISKKVVRSCLKSLPDGSEVEERSEQATSYKFKVKVQLDNKIAGVTTAQEKYRHFESECSKCNLINKFENENTKLSKERLCLKANEEEIQSQQLEVIGLLKNEAVLSAQSKQLELTDRIKSLNLDLEKISLIISAYEDLFQIVKDLTLPELDWVPPSDNDVAARLTAFQEQLRQIRSERRKLDATSKSIEQTVQKWIEDCQSKYANLNNSVRKLKAWFSQDYEQLCDRFCEELNLRLKSIQESLGEVDRDRDKLIEQTLGAAKAGIDTLNALTKQSKLPPILTHFSERSFLKIRLNDPVDLAERKSRIEQLIDHIIDATKVPLGIELVQQAVRRLAKPIRIEVLFPDADSSRSAYIPIADMKKQSGGEYLTSAILIYCTLARVRANNRGDRLDKTSTLLLDNPIGKASRPKFLELQREVARAMNIQLIFTTGIDDLEALSIFPNIIRLRNERQDPATGEKILEMEPDAGSIEAARLQITADRDNSKT
jgi:hypothetical protein